MNIEQVRAFLHAQDTTDLWDMLRWINDQTCLADHGGDVDPAYDYLRGALTEDVRAVALDTIWAAIWAETQRVERTWIHPTEGEVEWYGGVWFASSKNNERFVWARVSDASKRAPVYTQRIVVSHRAALDTLPRTLRWEFGARLAGCAEHMIRALRDVPRAAFRAWATEEYARFCIAFLLGPARGSTSYLPPTRPYPMLP